MAELPRLRDLQFLLYDVLKTHELCERPRFDGHDRAGFDAVLGQAEALARDVFEPFAARLDAEEPTFDGERVTTIPELPTAIAAYVDAGFPAMSFPEAHGGLGLPFTVASAAGMLFTAANGPAQGYAFLTAGAANLLLAFGSAEQIATYAAPMIEGRWFGTMALSETQAGSSLADIATRATPREDGAYRLTGSKMWISGAEHELRENIVNLVLARIDGAPAGVKGISLFVVPKFMPDADGRPGARNGVRLVGLNRKMGQRGTTNTVLALGAEEPCVGFLVGEPHQGLRYMFHMMNEARIGVGAGAAVTAWRGYLEALAYARERRQGRALNAKTPNAPAVPIIEHPDVMRMLLAQKAIAEGSVHLCLAGARLVDEIAVEDDPAKKADLQLLLEVLTPIIKSWPSERGCEANSLAIQVHGGYGYTHDFPVERLYRDQRLNPIHEGTTGVQGLDLLGRKMRMEGGRGAALLISRIKTTTAEARAAGWTAQADALDAALDRAAALTMTLLIRAARDPRTGLGGATLYLGALGTIVAGWLWLQQVLALVDAPDDAFKRGKHAAARWLFAHDLPLAVATLGVLEADDDLLLTPPDDL